MIEAELPPLASSLAALEPQSYQELAARAGPHTKISWLWHGYLAAGEITLLTSQWKTGKTTLLAVLLERMHSGRALAGREVRTGRAAVITEESPVHWRLRGERLDFGAHACFFCRPFLGKPTRDQWRGLVDRLVRLRTETGPDDKSLVRHGLDLVAIDTLSSFLPCGVENQADGILEVLRPLEQLTAAGVAVLLLHHPRKGAVYAGQSARGSGALTAYADIVLELTCLARSRREDRRRLLSAWSRHDDTPPELMLELSADGRDYTVWPGLEDEQVRALKLVCEILASERKQMTRAQILYRWPERTKPAPSTLWTYLQRGVEQGKLTRAGSGCRGNAFRYKLPGTDFDWDVDPYELLGV
jgi:hypothetical protein